MGAESREGEGSEFWFRLSLEKRPSPEVREVSDRRDLKGVRILVVDDNPTNREILLTRLGGWGMEAEAAEDGPGALEALRAARDRGAPFEVALLDMQMPGMDGLEASRRIRALDRPDAAVIPIIAMTANAFEDDRRHCLEAGMNDHVGKPVDPEVLYQVLLRWLDKGAAAVAGTPLAP